MTILRTAKPENEIEYIDTFEILGKEKQENKDEERDYIAEELKQKVEKIKTSKLDQIEVLNTNKYNNKIQYIECMEILSREKGPLYIDQLDFLEILVNQNLRIKLRSKNYIIERIYVIEILSREKEPLKNVVVSENNSFMIFSNNNKNFEKIINEEKKKVKELNQKLEKYEKYSNNNLNLMEIIDLQKELLRKDKEIEKIKSRYPFELLEGEEMIAIIISTVSQAFNFAIICKNTDIFVDLEIKLYKEYPNYYNPNNYFMGSGIVINKFKSLKDNNIHNSDTILLHNLESSTIIK